MTFAFSHLDLRKFNTYTAECPSARDAIITAFIEETPRLLLDLDFALDEGDRRLAAMQLHKMKPSLLILSSDELNQFMHEVEADANNRQSFHYLIKGRVIILKVGILLDELKTYQSYLWRHNKNEQDAAAAA